MDDKEGRQIPDKRRRRVERFKVYIRVALFLKRIIWIPLCLLYGACALSGMLSLIRFARQRNVQELQRQREQLIDVRMAETQYFMPDDKGEIFGQLLCYEQESYWRERPVIRFDSRYGYREWEVVSVYFSRMRHAQEEVYEYYQFFQTDTPEEFDTWYGYIKKLSLYDTGVDAAFGDEFVILNCCADPEEDRQFVMIARLK